MRNMQQAVLNEAGRGGIAVSETEDTLSTEDNGSLCPSPSIKVVE